MIERTHNTIQVIGFEDNDSDEVNVWNYGDEVQIERCFLDRDMTTALVERLQLWLATGSLHKGKEG